VLLPDRQHTRLPSILGQRRSVRRDSGGTRTWKKRKGIYLQPLAGFFALRAGGITTSALQRGCL